MADLQLVKGDEPVISFLHYLYDGLDGFAYSPTEVQETGEWSKKFFKVPEQINDLRDWILARSPNVNVYISPAVFKTADCHRINFKESNVVWTEFDGNTPKSTGDIPQPTLRLQSSSAGHEHWYWKLQSKIESVTEVESINRSITYTLGADASSWDASQILRPPGTTNHKQGIPTVLLEDTGLLVSSSIFSVEEFPEPEPSFTLSNIPDVSEVVLGYAFKKEVIDLYKTPSFPVGSRSAALMKLGYFLAEMGMSDAEMFAVLRNADDRWKKFKDRTDRDRRLVDLITKARIKYPKIEIVLTEEQIPIYGFQSFLDTEIEIEWLVPGILQSLGYLLLTGPAGVGKTQFSLRWAINLALGKQYLKHEITRPLRILFMSLEMGHADLKYFVSSMAIELSDAERLLLEQNLILAPIGEPLYIDNEKGQQKFEGLLEAIKPDIFMWDSLGSATGAQLSDETTVKKLMDFNDRIRQKYNVASWIIHHNRKATVDNKKPNKQSDIYGNQYIVNRATTIYCLYPVGQNVIEVIPLKKRLSKLEPNWAIERIDATLDFVRKNLTLLTEASVADEEQPADLTDKELEVPKPEVRENPTEIEDGSPGENMDSM